MRRLLIPLLLLLPVAGLAQKRDTARSPSQVWVGKPGITESVKKIMQREPNSYPRFIFRKMTEEEGPERWTLPQNPLSPAVSQWPIPGLNQATKAAGRLNQPLFSVGTNFNAWDLGSEISQGYGFVPPDTQGDVSPTQVVIGVNGRVRVFSRTGTLGALDVSTDTFFDSVRSGSISDPRVRFDRLAGRWFIIGIDTAGVNNRVVFGVSSGATITDSSSFTFFQFSHSAVTPAGDTGQFFDYPTLGIDKNALYIGGNVFTAGGSYVGTSAFVVRKSSLTSGGPVVATAFRALAVGSGAGMYTPQGVDNDDPDATEGYFIGVDNAVFSKLVLRRVTDPGGTPTISGDVALTVPTTSFPRTVPALGSTKSLSGLDDRLFVAKICRNLRTGEKTLWTSHNFNVDTTGVASGTARANGSRWYQIAGFSTGSTPSLVQSGTVFDPAAANADNAWIPAAVMNGQGHALLGFSMASGNRQAGVGIAQRASTDALGTMGAITLVQPSSTSYNPSFDGGSAYRWGDYSHSVVDPSDGMTVWTFQEYCNAANSWGTRVIQLLAPPPAAIASISPTTGTSSATPLDITVNGTSTNNSGFFDPGTGYPKRLSASFSGTGITVSSVTFTSPTQIHVFATISPSAAGGLRNLTITNPDGQSTTINNAFTVNSLKVSSVSLPATIASGASGTGSVTLSENASAGGVSVSLIVNNGALTIPSSVTVAAGSSTANFNYTAAVVGSPTSVKVTATLNGTATADTVVNAPGVSSLLLNQASLTGGSATVLKATVTIDQAAPPTGVKVPLTSDSASVTPPATVFVQGGQTTATVTVPHTSIAVDTTVTLKSSWQGVDRTASVVVFAPVPTTATITPASVPGGSVDPVKMDVTINVAAPVGGLVLPVVSLLPDKVVVPATVTVPEGTTTASFPITTLTVPSTKVVRVVVGTAPKTKSATLTLTASGIKSFTFAKSEISGGSTTVLIGRVGLTKKAPVGGATVLLSDPSGLFSMPASITIPAGATVGTFNLSAPTAVATPTQVRLTANFNGEWPAYMTVVPPQLFRVSVTPTSVVGGSATVVKLKVTLDAPAPAGGRLVSLSCPAGLGASLPASVLVPAGSLFATVTVTHSHVTSVSIVNLTGLLDSVQLQTPLTINP